MPAQVTQLGIFVSCPTDVNSYRDLVAKIVRENERSWSEAFGVQVVLRDSRDVASGVSLDGPQDIINREMRGKYDFYLGLMGPKFGTETRTFGSGTEEEYYIALEGFLEDKIPYQMLFGFCRDKVDPFLIDERQLERVKAFRTSLTGHHLYFEWCGTEDFRKRIRQQLETTIRNYVNDAKTAIRGGGRYS